MAYFSQGDGRKKLMLLYFLSELNLEIGRNQIYTIFAEQGWMEFFDFQSAFAQLEEDAFIAGIPMALGEGYCVTAQGQAALKLFTEELPYSLREKMRHYAKTNRELLKNEAQFASTQSQLPDGGHVAVLRIADKANHVLDISLQLPTAQLANTACANWPAHAEAIYQQILKLLFEDGK